MQEILVYIVVLMVAPLIAVLVGQLLQERAKKREDKLKIVKTFVRHLGELVNIMNPPEMSKLASQEWAQADNLVPIVFYKSEKVLEKWQ